MECHQVRILVFSDSVMRDRTIKYMKVLWTNRSEREPTLELEAQIREKYPDSSSLVSNRLFICGSFSQPCISDAEFGDEFL